MYGPGSTHIINKRPVGLNALAWIHPKQFWTIMIPLTIYGPCIAHMLNFKYWVAVVLEKKILYLVRQVHSDWLEFIIYFVYMFWGINITNNFISQFNYLFT